MSHRFHRFTQILDLLNLLGKSHADFADNADFRPVRSWISADFTDDTDSTGVTKRGNRIPSLLFYNQTKTICLIGEINFHNRLLICRNQESGATGCSSQVYSRR